jgi:hypothetical protein
VNEVNDALERFLESDVQGSAGIAADILEALDQIESGEVTTWEMTGNAHTLILSPEAAEIQQLWTDTEPRTVSLAELRSGLERWLERLRE